MLLLVLFILSVENVYFAKNEQVESQDLIDSTDFRNAIAKELLKKKLLNLESARQQDSLAQFLRKGDKKLARGKPNFKVDDDPSRKQAQMANSFIASSNLLFGTKSQRKGCNATSKPTNKETVLDMQSLRHSFSGFNEEGIDFPSSKDASNSTRRKRTSRRWLQDPISCYLIEPKKITCMHRDVIYKIQLPSSDVADEEIGRIVESIYKVVEGNKASIGKSALEDSYKTKRASEDYIKSLFLNNLLLSSHPKTALLPTYNGNSAIYLPFIIPVSQSSAKAPINYYPGLLVDPKLQMPYNLSISGGADALSDIGAIGRNVLIDNGYGQYLLPEGYFISASNLHQRSENNLTADEEKRRNWLALMATNGYVPVDSGINAKLANQDQPHLVDSLQSFSEGKETLGSNNKLTIPDMGDYLDKLFNQRQERDTCYLRRRLRKNQYNFVNNSRRADNFVRFQEEKLDTNSKTIQNFEGQSRERPVGARSNSHSNNGGTQSPCPCLTMTSTHTTKYTTKCTHRLSSKGRGTTSQSSLTSKCPHSTDSSSMNMANSTTLSMLQQATSPAVSTITTTASTTTTTTASTTASTTTTTTMTTTTPSPYAFPNMAYPTQHHTTYQAPHHSPHHPGYTTTHPTTMAYPSPVIITIPYPVTFPTTQCPTITTTPSPMTFPTFTTPYPTTISTTNPTTSPTTNPTTHPTPYPSPYIITIPYPMTFHTSPCPTVTTVTCPTTGTCPTCPTTTTVTCPTCPTTIATTTPYPTTAATTTTTASTTPCPTCPTCPTTTATTATTTPCPPCPSRCSHATKCYPACPTICVECEESRVNEASNVQRGYKPNKPAIKLFNSDTYLPFNQNQHEYTNFPQFAENKTREFQNIGVYSKMVSNIQKDSLFRNITETMDLKSRNHRDSFFSRLRSKFHKGVLINGTGSSNTSFESRVQNKLHPIIRFNQGSPGKVWRVSHEPTVTANPMKRFFAPSTTTQVQQTSPNQTRSIFHINQPNQPNQPIIPITSPQPPSSYTQPSLNQTQPFGYQQQGNQPQPMESQPQPLENQPQPQGIQLQPQDSQLQPQGTLPQQQGTSPLPTGNQPQPQWNQPQPQWNQPQPQDSQSQSQWNKFQPQWNQPQPQGNQPQPQGNQPQPQGSPSPQDSSPLPLASSPLPLVSPPQPLASPPPPQTSSPQPQANPTQLQASSPQPQVSALQPQWSPLQPQGGPPPPQPQESPLPQPQGDPQPQGSPPMPQGTSSLKQKSRPHPTVSKPPPITHSWYPSESTRVSQHRTSKPPPITHSWYPSESTRVSQPRNSTCQTRPSSTPPAQNCSTISTANQTTCQTKYTPSQAQSSISNHPEMNYHLPNQTCDMKPLLSGCGRQVLRSRLYSPSQTLFYHRLQPQYMDGKWLQAHNDKLTAQDQASPMSQTVSKLENRRWQHFPSNEWGLSPNQGDREPLWNQGHTFYQPSLNLPQIYPNQGLYPTHLRIQPNVLSPVHAEHSNEIGQIAPLRRENSNHNARLPRTSFRLQTVNSQGYRGPRKIKWPLNHNSIHDKIARVRRYLQNRGRKKRLKL